MGFSRLKKWFKNKTTPPTWETATPEQRAAVEKSLRTAMQSIEQAAKNVYIDQGWTDEDGRWTEKGRKRHSPPHDQEKAW